MNCNFICGYDSLDYFGVYDIYIYISLIMHKRTLWRPNERSKANKLNERCGCWIY
jgi:hypothetical protein